MRYLATRSRPERTVASGLDASSLDASSLDAGTQNDVTANHGTAQGEGRARLRPGREPGRPWHETQLFGLEVGTGQLQGTRVEQLEMLLHPGDLLVLNDASTIPASFEAETLDGLRLEVRLAGVAKPATAEAFPAEWWVVILGDGDWRTPTEDRAPPPAVVPGSWLSMGSLGLKVLARSTLSPRLLHVRFSLVGDALADALFRYGLPVQYSHHEHVLRLGDVQTPYGSRPWAMEMASTGRPLRWPLLRRLQQRGVQLAWLTHAAGLSATGDAAIDGHLPLPERYHIPERTRRRLKKAQRVIAAGTTVVRALEHAGRDGSVRAGQGIADNRLGPRSRRRVVDGIISGVHAPGESHWELLRAFAPDPMLADLLRLAEASGALAHEFGDLVFIR